MKDAVDERVRIECPSCRGTLFVRKAHIGRRGKCNKCGAKIQVRTTPSSRSETYQHISELPPHVYVLARRDTSTILDLVDTAGIDFICLWKCEEAYADWCANHQSEFSALHMARDTVLGAILDSRCAYILIDPPADPTTPAFRIEKVSKRHLMFVQGVAFLRELHKQWGLDELEDEDVRRTVQRIANFEDITASQALNRFTEMMSPDYDGPIPKPMMHHLVNAYQIQASAAGMNEDLIAATVETAIHENINLSKAADIFAQVLSGEYQGAIPEPVAQWMRQNVDGDAFRRLETKSMYPPPNGCPICTESSWELLSLSSNRKAARWKCGYCGRLQITQSAEAVSR